MRNLVARLRRWWRPGDHPPGTPVLYEVACTCGQIARGQRQQRHQVIRCGSCRQPIFVLPLSPFPGLSGAGSPPEPADKNSASRPPAAGPVLKPWHWPVVAAAVTLVGVCLVYAVVLSALRSRPAASTREESATAEAHAHAGQKALAAGNFRRAADELSAARGLLEQHPEASTAAETRRVLQLHRQAALLADLLSESLGEILQRAAGLQEEEWQSQFEHRYQNHAIIFDADVARDAAGHFQLDYHVRAGPEPARIDVGDLKVLAALPRERPARLLFGARLAGMRREPPGTWVVHFDPDSGVLLTDLDAVAACCPPPIDGEMTALVKRQSDWLAELP